MSLIFNAPEPVLVPTSDGRLFPVGRLFCIGRNYAEHAREMGVQPDPEDPFFFTKWADTIVPDGAVISYPPGTTDFQHEVELVVALGSGGRDISVDQALDHVWGYAVGLDMTRRDLQMTARAKGRPWDAGKNFEQASPLALIHPKSSLGSANSGAISLLVNGEQRQRGDLSELITPVDGLISYLSSLYELRVGDLIYTGTPAGVGPVEKGDVLVAEVAGLSNLTVTIGE
jgi:fumarylpyruvate hydrolase